MAYKYCTDCGSRVEYIGSLPKFCSDCGVTLASGSVKRVVKGSIASRNVSLEDDETDIHFVPRIDSLQFDVEPFAQKTFKLEDLVGADATQPPSDTGENLSNVERTAEEA